MALLLVRVMVVSWSTYPAVDCLQGTLLLYYCCCDASCVKNAGDAIALLRGTASGLGLPMVE